MPRQTKEFDTHVQLTAHWFRPIKMAERRRGIIGVMTDVTPILSQIESGDPTAAEQLLLLVYDELRKLSNDTQHLAFWLAQLPDWAAKNRADVVEQVFDEIRRALMKCHGPVGLASEQFTLARRSDNPICIAGTNYASAHEAVVCEAWAATDRIFYRVVCGADDGPSVRLLPERWEANRAAILDRHNDQWLTDFARIPALLKDERAQLGRGDVDRRLQSDPLESLSWNERMALMLAQKSEAEDWTIRQWAEKLCCSIGTVHKQPVWQELQKLRPERLGLDRRQGRRGKRIHA